METWLVILALDKEPIHTLIEGVVPATYRPSSEARWCMCKAADREAAIRLAEDSFYGEVFSGERISVVSIARLCDVEAV